MNSSNFKMRKVQNPQVHVNSNAINQYETSLSALNDVWSSIAATKKELSSVHSKIRRSEAIDPRAIHVEDGGDYSKSQTQPSYYRKAKDSEHISRTVTYMPVSSTTSQGFYHKENIPPASLPKPTFHGYNEERTYDKESDFYPTRKKLYADESKMYNGKYDAPNFEIPVKHQNINSSVIGRSLLKNQSKSDAIARLKEKINQQKINASNTSLNKSQQLDIFPEKHQHNEDEAVQIKSHDMMQPMKRKVSQAPEAPSYKGFNQPETTFIKSSHMIRKQRQITEDQQMFRADKKIGKVKKSPQLQRKGKTKTNRVIAPKKQSNPITTSSWRVSEDIKKKLKAELKSKNNGKTSSKKLKKKDKSEVQKSELVSNSKDVTEISSAKDSLNKDTLSSVKPSSNDNKDTESNNDMELEEQPLEEALSVDENNLSGNDNDNTKVDGEISHDEESMMNELSKSKTLTKNAKDILNDMNQQPSKEFSTSSSPPKQIVALVDTGLKKSKLSSKKSPPNKRKLDDESRYTKQKQRHYDQDKVQKYMAKQLAERKKRRLDEKKQEDVKKEEQELKLKALYNKQKTALKESLKDKKKVGPGYRTSDKPSTRKKMYSNVESGNFQQSANDLESLKQNLASMASMESDRPYQMESDRPYPMHVSIRGGTRRKDNTLDTEVFKDSLDDTTFANDDRSQHGSSFRNHQIHTQVSTSPNTRLQSTISYLQQTHATPTTANSYVPNNQGEGSVTKRKEDRVAAIRATANALREQLDIESKRLTNLVHSKHNEVTKLATPIEYTIPIVSLNGHQGGEYPGTANIDETVATNEKMENMNKAAEKIQAAYRGHNVRQSFHWNLPSGRTLYETMEEGRRRAFLNDIHIQSPVELASSKYPSVINYLEEQKKRKAIPDLSLEKDSLVQSSSWKGEHLAQSTMRGEQFVDSRLHVQSNPVLSEANSSTQSLINEAMENSRAALDDDTDITISSISLNNNDLVSRKEASRLSYSADIDHDNMKNVNRSHHSKPHEETLRSILKRHKDTPPDKYSVINVFARKYPGLRKQQMLDESYSRKVPSSPGSDTENIIADAYSHQFQSVEQDASLDEYLTEQNLEDDAMESTLTENLIADNMKHLSTGMTSENRSSKLNSSTLHQQRTGMTSENRSSKLNSSTLHQQRTLLSPKMQISNSESDGSERLFSPHSRTPDKLRQTHSPIRPIASPLRPVVSPLRPITSPFQSIDSYSHKESSGIRTSNQFEDDSSTVITHDQTPSASDIDNGELNPVMSSTRRSPQQGEKDSTPLRGGNPLIHQINYTRGSRMSPDTLERRLHAEINLFDNVGDSLQQFNDMERIRSIVQAQQESVTLAQLVKSRQQSHQHDLEKLSFQAKEKAMQSARDIESARAATREADANTLKAIAEIKSKAADNILESTQSLVKVQNEATAVTKDALDRIDVARQQATDAYKLAAERQIVDVEKIATAAASAASSKAVEVALQHHKQQLEELRLRSISRISSTSSGSSQSYSKVKSSTYTNKSELSKYDSHTFVETNNRSSASPTSANFSPSFRTRSVVTGSPPMENYSKFSPERTKSPTSPPMESYSKSPSTIRTKSAFSGSPPLESYSELPSIKNKSKLSLPSEGYSLASAPDEQIQHEEESVVEDISEEDRELSEALFSTKKKSTQEKDSSSLKNDESIDEKFHSSFTEDELKQELRMVLPSENHRRKSLDQLHFSSTAHETSSDEVVTLQNANKWSKKRSKSPFVEEDTFQKFTSGLVRQYIHEEEVRSKHQEALLALREKAIIEKTKAEMAFLEMKRKSLKGKGHDEKMPPISKKQRALKLKLQAEQNEIRRLKEAYKAASQERKLMLDQQKEIQRIRESTQKIWNKVEHAKSNVVDDRSETEILDDYRNESGDKSITFNLGGNSQSINFNLSEKSQSIKDDVDDAISERSSKKSDVSERLSRNSEISERISTKSATSKTRHSDSSIAESMSKNESTLISQHISRSRTASEKNEVAEDLSVLESSTISTDLKKLKYMSSKRYLTDRERKLQMRQQKFQDILQQDNKIKTWKEKIIEDERKLKGEIRRALKNKDLNELDDDSNKSSPHFVSDEDPPESISAANDSYKSTDKSNGDKSNGVSDVKHVESDFSIGEDVPSVNESVSGDQSINESINEHSSNNSKKSAQYSIKSNISENVKSEGSSSKNSVVANISNSHRSITTSNKSSKPSKSSTKYSPNYSQDTFHDTVSKSHHALENKRNDEDSFTEGTSDASDVEQRLKGLEKELHRRKNQLQTLRRKKEKEQLRKKEQALRKELQAVEQLINKENNVPSPETTPSSFARRQQPRVLSPRNSLESIILPEKIKLPKDIESRRSLDFSEKDLEILKSPRSFSKVGKSVKSIDKSKPPVSPDESISDKSLSTDKSKSSEKSISVLKSKSPRISLSSDRNDKSQDTSHQLSDPSTAFDLTDKTAENSLSEHFELNEAPIKSFKSSLKDKTDSSTSIKDDASADNSTSIKDDVSAKSHSLITKDKNISEKDITESVSVESIHENRSVTISEKVEDAVVTQSHGDDDVKTTNKSAADIYDDDFFESDVTAVKSSLSQKDSLKSESKTSAKSSLSSYGDDFENSGSPSQITNDVEALSHGDSVKSGKSISEKSRSLKSISDKSKSINLLSKKNQSENSDSSEKTLTDKSEKSLSELIEELSAKSESDKTISDKPSKSNSDKLISEKPYNFYPEEELSKASHTSDNSRISVKSDNQLKSLDSSHDSVKFSSQFSVKVSDEKITDSTDKSTSISTSKVRDSFSKSNVSSALGYHVNDRVLVEDTMKGFIRFLGKTPFSPVLVAGIELDEAFGTNNGSFQNKQYFQCAEDHGLFTTIERLEKIEKEKSEDDIIDEILSQRSISPDISENENFLKSPTHSLTSPSSTKSKNDEKISKSPHHSDGTRSSSDLESLDGEIPSPDKLDLNPLADSITNGIMKSLLQETFELSSQKDKHDLSSKTDRSDLEIEQDSKLENETRENVLRERTDDKVAVTSVNTALSKLLSDAVSHMITVKKEKQTKLKTETSSLPKDNFMSFLVSDPLKSPPVDEEKELDSDLLALKLDKLKNVHDQLGELLGDDDDDDDYDFDNNRDKLDVPPPEDILPVKQVDTVKPFQIPYKEAETRNLVFAAYNEILNRGSVSLNDIEPSRTFIESQSGKESYDKNYTKLFNTLVFDLTKSQLEDIEEFREMQTKHRPDWIKATRRTFSKFTRQTQMVRGDEVCKILSEYISVCLDLTPGRPSLEKLKKKLPLNPSKKDYVDAVLVEEIREEEAQWVNYDDDELKVKYQLADSILDSLLDEIVDTLSTAS